jgi:hypothetical protein
MSAFLTFEFNANPKQKRNKTLSASTSGIKKKKKKQKKKPLKRFTDSGLPRCQALTTGGYQCQYQVGEGKKKYCGIHSSS